MREAKELAEPTELYYAQPLNDDLFEWHFTIRGPDGSDFAGGIYHGRISLPTEYPMKPPNITFLTPNGRFELFRELCLSISGYHPETWRPSWSIRTALLAIIGFMPTSGAGAIGSLDLPPEKRRELAVSSLNYSCDVCGYTKDLVLPLTDASAKIAKEATEVASQFNIIDQSAQKNDSDKESLQEGTISQTKPISQSSASFSPNSGFHIQMPSVFNDLKIPNSTTLGSDVKTRIPVGVPQPKYWLCVPVYDNPAATDSPPFPQSVPSAAPPPLSFEEWLKKRGSSTPPVSNPKTNESFQDGQIRTVVPTSCNNSTLSNEILNFSSASIQSENNTNANNNEVDEANKKNADSSPVVKEKTHASTSGVKFDGSVAEHETIRDVSSDLNSNISPEPSSSTFRQPDMESADVASKIVENQPGTGTPADKDAAVESVHEPSDDQESASTTRQFGVEVTTSIPLDASPETRRRFAVSVTKTTSIKKVQSPKDVAQKILRDAAARHQRVMSSPGSNNVETAPESVRKAKMAAFVLSLLLLVLVCRRLALIVL